MPQRIPTLLARAARRSVGPKSPRQPSVNSAALLQHYHQNRPLLKSPSVLTATTSEIALNPRLARKFSTGSWALTNLIKRTVTAPTTASEITSNITPSITPSITSSTVPPSIYKYSYSNTYRTFMTSHSRQYAAPLPADSIVETLTELYGTARDEFEIAAEETEKKTVYAADDRQAAQEAFQELKKAYEDALTQSEPEVGKEVQGRVGHRLRELGNALTALEESALED